jgi:hypothetical protein
LWLRRADRSSISFIPLADLGGKSLITGLISSPDPHLVVGANLLCDQAGWEVGQALSELGTGELDPQHNGAALVLTDKMEAVLAQIDAQRGDNSRERRP